MFSVLFLVLASSAVFAQTVPGSTVCSQIANNITGGVYYPLSVKYIADNQYYYFQSSSNTPTCIVEADSPQDVSIVMRIIGLTRTPFAVKSGGHASNPGFSSTSGVQISLIRMKQIILGADNKTVEVGMGAIWTDVYEALEGSGVNVVGGRVGGPGTGGFTLGGGYSWKTQQFGLTSDTVKAFNLVLPNGTTTTADSSTPDLFFALKGGLNRFGIVTSIVYETHPQAPIVYGGIQLLSGIETPKLIEATALFQEQNTDPKAQVISTINGGTIPTALVLYFYDGPERPASFDPFNDITALIDTVASQTYGSFAKSIPSQIVAGAGRGAFTTMMTTVLTPGFLNAVYNETLYWGTLALAHAGVLLSYDVEPFNGYGQYATESAFPHSDSPLPLNLYYFWELEAEDSYWRGVMQESINTLTDVAKQEGIYTDAPVYPNYALDTYSSEQIYGATNAARLRAIQAMYDPESVMQLTGGFAL